MGVFPVKLVPLAPAAGVSPAKRGEAEQGESSPRLVACPVSFKGFCRPRLRRPESAQLGSQAEASRFFRTLHVSHAALAAEFFAEEAKPENVGPLLNKASRLARDARVTGGG